MPENNTTYDGEEFYCQIDAELYKSTGEIKIVDAPIGAHKSTTKLSTDRSGFEITYLAYLFDVFDQLGGQKYKVFKYIVQHKSSDNTLIITNRELAEKCNVSTQTVWQALKLLKNRGLIATRTGAIMVLPRIAMYGGKRKEAYLMRKFELFGNDTDEKTNERR